MLPKLSGNPKDVAAAAKLRTPELLERLEADLSGALERSVLPDAARERAKLPEALAVLRAIDDASWWLSNREHLPPHPSKRAYEDYPWPLWEALGRQLARVRESAGLAGGAGDGIEFEPCSVEDHAQLEPEVPDALVEALRKGGHLRFLIAGERVVAVHGGGVRFIGAKGKPTARGVPKGSGQVEGLAIADDGSFVLLRNAGGLHRVAIPDKTLASWPTPPQTMPSGLCSLAHGRFAMISNAPALVVYELREGKPEVVTEAIHAELDSYASLDRVGNEVDTIFVRSKTPTGDRVTLVASYDGSQLAWIGRHPLSLFAPRRADDGSIVLLAGRDGAVRMRSLSRR